VCGHSLGGALAVITASRLAADPLTDVDAVYTFGMPRPGTADFGRNYNAYLGMRTYRLVQGDDLVPTVAPSEMGFRHVGRYLRCFRLGMFRDQNITADTQSDDPSFVEGVAEMIRDFVHSPFGKSGDAAAQLRLVAEMALGTVPPGTRTDPGGLAIELLPSQIRDHMLGASGRSPTKNLSIVKQRVRVHGRRLSWLLGWHRSVDRSVLGCVLRASAGVAERRRARV